MPEDPYMSPDEGRNDEPRTSDSRTSSQPASAPIPAFASVFMISVCGLVVGASILSGFLGGPVGVLGGPILAVFGWFYLPLIMLCVAALRAAHHPGWNAWRATAFVVGAGCVGSGLMLLVGVRGPETDWLWGYGIGGFLAGVTCAALTVRFKRAA